MVFQKKRCKNTRIFRDNLQENGKSKRRKGRRWENGVQKGRVTAMSGSFGIRTDLAVESKEKYEKDNVEIKGVAIHEEYEESLDLNTTVVRIQTEQGARAMEKPRGTYITMEAPNLIVPDEDYHREISVALAHHLRELLHLEKEKSILVVGLGNREITPDALGPRVIQNLKITRHIVKEYGKAGMGKERVHQISSLVPGVMAQTGMETMEIIRGVIREIEEGNSGEALFDFDSDEDVFCVYSQYIDDLMMLAKMIRAACADEKTMGMYLNMSEVAKA